MKDFCFHYSRRKVEEACNTVKEAFLDIYSSDIEFNELSEREWRFIGVRNEHDLSDGIFKNREHNKALYFIIGNSENYNTTNMESNENSIGYYNKVQDFNKEVNDHDGNFIFIFLDVENNSLKVASSKLGLIPCYYLVSKTDIILASRLSILLKAAGPVDIEHGVLAQYCLYNYIISDKTFFQNIYALPAANIADFNLNTFKVSFCEYWDSDDETEHKPLGFDDSVNILDESLDKIFRELINPADNIGLSLTGGWDGRLLLSYARKYLNSENILLYSFGTPDSPDVFLPKQAARNLSHKYMLIDLKSEDYSRDKLRWAMQTVFLSDGMRSFKRAHYLYAMNRLYEKVDYIISGIGGSNLIKSGAYKPSNVLNKYVIELLSANDYNRVMEKHFDYLVLNYPESFARLTKEGFINSFNTIRFQNLMNNNPNINKRIVSFLLKDVERKYFGGELLSYRHLVNNYSPFFDMRFIRGLSKTIFWGGYETRRSVSTSYRNALLYAKLVCRNYPELGRQTTDRGFSLHDILKPVNPMIIYKYIRIKKDHKTFSGDYFNNNDLFDKYAKNNNISAVPIDSPADNIISNYLSALSFLNRVEV